MSVTKTCYISSFDGENIFVTSEQNSSQPLSEFVFVHGMAGDAEAYHQLSTLLLANIPNTIIHRYDLRGHGFSSYRFPQSDKSVYDVLSKDLDSLYEKLHLKSPILLGQSMAGLIIQNFINLYPSKKIAGVILISSTFSLFNLSLAPQFWYGQLSQWSQKLPWQQRRRQSQDHLHFKGSWDYSPPRLATDIYFTRLSKYILLWLTVFGWKNQHIQVLNAPTTLYISGTQDLVIPPFVQKQNKVHIPKAKYEELPTNHNAIVNNPEMLADRIIAFVKTLPKQR